MRLLIIALFISLLVSCKNEKKAQESLYPEVEKTAEQLGQELFEGKGNCIACHQPEQKIVGPSIAQIAKTYKEKKASIVSFLKEESEPIVDPSQYEVMKTNFAITKNMSDAELQALESYMHSFAK